MRLCWRFSQQWQCLIASLPGNEIYIRGDAARRALHFPKHTHSSSVVISTSAMLDCCHATYEQLVLKLCANSTAVNKQPSGQREQFLVGHAVISSRQIHRSSRDTRARTCAHLDASVLEHRSACTHRTHMHMDRAWLDASGISKCWYRCVFVIVGNILSFLWRACWMVSAQLSWTLKPT